MDLEPIDLEPMELTCPRCGGAARARFYGPCDECRGTLRETMRLDVEPGEAPDPGRFEPKMHVVPNQVALKE